MSSFVKAQIRIYAVVIAQRNDRIQAGLIDLLLFDPEDGFSCQRRLPESGREVDPPAFSFLVFISLFSPELSDYRKFFGIVRNKIEHLF